MATCSIEPAALRGILKMARALGSFDDVWLEAGQGAVSFRAAHVGRYAIVGITIPAPGCEDVPKRFLGLPFVKLEEVVKGVKGKLDIEWADKEEGKDSGRITFKNAGKRRSFLMLAKAHADVVREVPNIPGQVSATLDVDALRKFFDEADGVGLVKVEMVEGGRLKMSARGDTGDELDWDAGSCEGTLGVVAKWSPGNCAPLIPTEFDGETLLAKFHPRGMRLDWQVGGQPCAIAIASMEDPE